MEKMENLENGKLGENLDREEGRESPDFFWYDRPRFDAENLHTSSSAAQEKVEDNVAEAYKGKCKELPELKRSTHINYLLKILSSLPSSYETLDCSRTWNVYWTLHSLSLLGHNINNEHKSAVVSFLKSCQHSEGGFGGGPGQIPHLAPTYAAVNALCLLGTKEAYEAVNRETIASFLWEMRAGDGSFYMHKGGERDIRGVYCAAVVSVLLNVQKKGLFDGSADWVMSCQTYEGGFSGNPGMEAHGGYTFCGIASIYLLTNVYKFDMKSLHRWTVNRQTAFEGGFQGRTNKLVDSCYSFWQSGSLAVLTMLSCDYGKCSDWLFDNFLLQEYILICCQHPQGGFVDKPQTSNDPYHTCYALSGLSLAQSDVRRKTEVIGSYDNKLVDIHPVFNLPMEEFQKAREYFRDC